MAGGAGIPPGMRTPGAPESGGVARVRGLNHRLQAGIPPGSRGVPISISHWILVMSEMCITIRALPWAGMEQAFGP